MNHRPKTVEYFKTVTSKRKVEAFHQEELQKD